MFLAFDLWSPSAWHFVNTREEWGKAGAVLVFSMGSGLVWRPESCLETWKRVDHPLKYLSSTSPVLGSSSWVVVIGVGLRVLARISLQFFPLSCDVGSSDAWGPEVPVYEMESLGLWESEGIEQTLGCLWQCWWYQKSWLLGYIFDMLVSGPN